MEGFNFPLMLNLLNTIYIVQPSESIFICIAHVLVCGFPDSVIYIEIRLPTFVEIKVKNMNIVLTGSLGNVGKPLTKLLVDKGHQVKVISSKTEKIPAIEALGGIPLIGTIQDAEFLASAFAGSDAVYLMEAWEAIGSLFDENIDFLAEFGKIASNYAAAVKHSGVTNIIHLSSIGAHTDKGMGSLEVHHHVEKILQELPENINIKFLRPVGFFSNIYRWLPMIQSQGAIIQSWGGDHKEPWVSPYDIAEVIAKEMEKPFAGRTVQYVASDEVSPNEIASALAKSIKNAGLQWKVIPSDELFNKMISSGINPWIAKGMVEMQQAQQDGSLYEDFYQNKPQFGNVKLEDFAKEFAEVYNKKQ